jgi:hypothetical protein
MNTRSEFQLLVVVVLMLLPFMVVVVVVVVVLGVFIMVFRTFTCNGRQHTAVYSAINCVVQKNS